MLYTCRIRLTTPILGDIRNHSKAYAGKQVFDLLRDEAGLPQLRAEAWAWAWQSTLPRDCYSNAVRMSTRLGHVTVRPAMQYEFKKRTPGGIRTTYHESIRQGAEITLAFRTVEIDPDEAISAGTLITDQMARMPTPDELKISLGEIGADLGISPYGKIDGYGRFKLLSLEPAGSHVVDRKQPGDLPSATEPAETFADDRSIFGTE